MNPVKLPRSLRCASNAQTPDTMGDEQDPAREPYKLKAREFERVNEPARTTAEANKMTQCFRGTKPGF
jgi:hypothetical protein